MTKELQDLVWALLPKEFKEEVKRLYYIANKDMDELKVAYKLEYLFGHHNLTSDAEGEDDEILHVSRKKLQYFYEKLRKVGESHAAFALQSLFGSKCLPDEKDNDYNVPEPIRQPFCQVKDVIAGDGVETAASTEPTEKEAKENAKTFAFDRIVKDGFSKERRLNIAVQLTQALLSNPTTVKNFTFTELAQKAVETTDTLIAECEHTDNLNKK